MHHNMRPNLLGCDPHILYNKPFNGIITCLVYKEGVTFQIRNQTQNIVFVASVH